jgi:FkbM family methyltransferase
LFEELFMNDTYKCDISQQEPFIVDCGANIGLATLYFKTVYPTAKIIAFEPDPRTFSVLSRNVSANAIRGVTLVNAALADTEGSASFWYDRDEDGSLKMSLIEARMPKSKQQVTTVMLSTYIDRPVSLLKIDVEGAEVLIIRDLSRNNKLQFVEQLVIEALNTPETEASLSEILVTLLQNGFHYQLSTDTPVPNRRWKYQDVKIWAYRS